MVKSTSGAGHCRRFAQTTLASLSNGQESDIVTLESYIHFGEQGGLSGALRLPRHAVGVGRAFFWSCQLRA